MSRSRFERVAGTLSLALLATLGLGSVLQAQEQRGFLGVNLECTQHQCGRRKEGDTAVWWFTGPPIVTLVCPRGPAARGGLRAGDAIVAVNGRDIVTEEAGQLFSTMRVGVPINFTVQRADREVSVTVTPVTERAAFDACPILTMQGEGWDSLQVRMRELYESQMQLWIALRQAQRELQRTEVESRRRESEEQRQRLVREGRAQIDSLRRALADVHVRITVQADSLVQRRLYVVPHAEPEVEVIVTPPEARTLMIYSDAVAGARFKELTPDSELLEYFPGVEQGLLITQVVENTPAHRAGLQDGDVVLEVNGELVRTVADLRRLWPHTGEVELTYVRKGERRACTIPPK
ncbi:MAG: hypothetical protein AMS25_13780 [Gemmatimonas sp. SM23_52]|jgi:membrane-associated protease RseP (regulator of RpoE activity)|nr:MAG: hypothetical protein AMS25_13780 [Gemmatimonas sp. SM23_52]